MTEIRNTVASLYWSGGAVTGVVVIRNIVANSHWPGDTGIFGAVITNTVDDCNGLMTLGPVVGCSCLVW